MSIKRHGLRTGLAAAVIAGGTLIGGAAHATPPGPGVSGRIIWQHTVGDTDFVLREVTLLRPGRPPAGTTTTAPCTRGSGRAR
nr:hypothetical protein GCM10020092_034460 [Actinoplanes digitatis]